MIAFISPSPNGHREMESERGRGDDGYGAEREEKSGSMTWDLRILEVHARSANTIRHCRVRGVP